MSHLSQFLSPPCDTEPSLPASWAASPYSVPLSLSTRALPASPRSLPLAHSLAHSHSLAHTPAPQPLCHCLSSSISHLTSRSVSASLGLPLFSLWLPQIYLPPNLSPTPGLPAEPLGWPRSSLALSSVRPELARTRHPPEGLGGDRPSPSPPHTHPPSSPQHRHVRSHRHPSFNLQLTLYIPATWTCLLASHTPFPLDLPPSNSPPQIPSLDLPSPNIPPSNTPSPLGLPPPDSLPQTPFPLGSASSFRHTFPLGSASPLRPPLPQTPLS